VILLHLNNEMSQTLVEMFLCDVYIRMDENELKKRGLLRRPVLSQSFSLGNRIPTV